MQVLTYMRLPMLMFSFLFGSSELIFSLFFKGSGDGTLHAWSISMRHEVPFYFIPFLYQAFFFIACLSIEIWEFIHKKKSIEIWECVLVWALPSYLKSNDTHPKPVSKFSLHLGSHSNPASILLDWWRISANASGYRAFIFIFWYSART